MWPFLILAVLAVAVLAVWLHHLFEGEWLPAVLAKICTSVSTQPFHYGDDAIKVTVSIGAAFQSSECATSKSPYPTK